MQNAANSAFWRVVENPLIEIWKVYFGVDMISTFGNTALSTVCELRKAQYGLTQAPRSDIVCKLRKALYGLKQAPRLWYAKIDAFLIGELRFVNSANVPCFYVPHSAQRTMLIALYVDDLLIAGNESRSIAWIKGELRKQFEMKDLLDSRFLKCNERFLSQLNERLKINYYRCHNCILEIRISEKRL